MSASRAPLVEGNLRHESKHCPILLEKKFFKGKKRIVDRMFPITGEPENKKGGGLLAWMGQDLERVGVGGGKRLSRIKCKK